MKDFRPEVRYYRRVGLAKVQSARCRLFLDNPVKVQADREDCLTFLVDREKLHFRRARCPAFLAIQVKSQLLVHRR